VAAGLLPESQAAELLEHSICCDACALLLRQATQDLVEETTEQEITQLSAIPSAQEDWQQSLRKDSARHNTTATREGMP